MTSFSHPALSPTETLHGVGPRVGELLARVAGPRVIDLALHMPVSTIDRRNITTTADALPGGIVTLVVTVMKIEKPKGKSKTTKIMVADESGPLALSYFNHKGDWLKKIYPVGKRIAVSGKIEMYEGTKQMVHPDVAVAADRLNEIAILEPVYPLTANLSPKILRKAIGYGLHTLHTLPEWQEDSVMAKYQWRNFADTLEELHKPQEAIDISPTSMLRERVAYDELLANQLAIAIVRDHTRTKRKTLQQPPSQGLPPSVHKLLSALPYKLTNAQQRVFEEITIDMNAPTRMVRLLQGDVGSGKTVIALLTMALAAARGEQAAIMAPTEILAQQHYESLRDLAASIGLQVALHTGSIKGKQRTAVLGAISSGDADIIIGTHALFQNKVEFKNLGCVVIDEQHRFGVAQRVELSNKGGGVDVLVMTATPIPRSLALTYYGDMEVSKLDEKPPGRQPIKTSKMDLKYLDDVIERVRDKLKTGERVYWVCPLIEESDVLDLAAAEDRARLLQEKLGPVVALMHGRLKAEEKLKVMEDFKSGRLPLLVSTTVIEVGVNVPEATVMIIDHAERFGLAQLHQLRGRVGRGNKPSACLLMYQGPLGETASARLKLMCETEDGFKLAEEDLRLRGAGEVLGTRQSGNAEFRIADLQAHHDLVLMARDESKYILARDPELQSERGTALRLLLRLFSMDHGVMYLKAG